MEVAKQTQSALSTSQMQPQRAYSTQSHQGDSTLGLLHTIVSLPIEENYSSTNNFFQQNDTAGPNSLLKTITAHSYKSIGMEQPQKHVFHNYAHEKTAVQLALQQVCNQSSQQNAAVCDTKQKICVDQFFQNTPVHLSFKKVCTDSSQQNSVVRNAHQNICCENTIQKAAVRHMHKQNGIRESQFNIAGDQSHKKQALKITKQQQKNQQVTKMKIQVIPNHHSNSTIKSSLILLVQFVIIATLTIVLLSLVVTPTSAQQLTTYKIPEKESCPINATQKSSHLIPLIIPKKCFKEHMQNTRANNLTTLDDLAVQDSEGDSSGNDSWSESRVDSLSNHSNDSEQSSNSLLEELGLQTNQNSICLKIAGINCQGWPSNQRRRKIPLANSYLNELNPDILLIIETAIPLSDQLLCCSDEYAAIHIPANRPNNQGENSNSSLGRGIAVLHKKQLRVQPILQQMCNDRFIIVQVFITPKHFLYIIGVHLDSHNIRTEKQKLAQILEQINQRFQEHPILVFGDLNVNYNHKCGKKYVQSFKNQWQPIISETATRRGYRNQQDTIIDYFFINRTLKKEFKHTNSTIQTDPQFSDHNILQIKLKARDANQLKVSTIPSPQTIDANLLVIRSCGILKILSDPNNSLLQIQQQLKAICSKELPLRNINNNYWSKMMDKMHKYNPNLTEENIKQFFHIEYKNFMEITLGQYNRTEIKQFYDNLKKATKMSKQSKLLNTSRGPIKRVFTQPITGQPESQILTNYQEIQEEIKNWFTQSIGQGDALAQPSGQIVQIEVREIESFINHFHGGRATSVDGFKDTYLSRNTLEMFVRESCLKKRYSSAENFVSDVRQQTDLLVTHTATNLAKLFNNWLTTKEIPIEHGTARFIFIYKQEQDQINGNAIDSFRPISVTSIFFKLIEIFLLNRIKLLQSQGTIKRLNPNQIGFQEGMGCEVNILKLIIESQQAFQDWTQKMVRGRPFLLFVDFKSAFDSCSHRILMLKLQRAGYPIEIINAIQVLYSNARISFSYTQDESLPVRKGVLQGGVLSPELFNRYIDDLADSLSNEGVQIYYYADDLAVLGHGKAKLKSIIDIIEKWCSRNAMQMNKKKCGILWLSRQQALTVKEIRTKEVQEIPILEHYKYLGVELSKNLRIQVQLDKIKQKIQKYEKMSTILRYQGVSNKILITLWKVFPAQILNYACFLSLESIQNKSIFNQYELIYKKSIKSAFGLAKNAPDSIITQHLLLPTALQSAQINLCNVIGRLLNNFRGQLKEGIQIRILNLRQQTVNSLNIDINKTSFLQKVQCVRNNLKLYSALEFPQLLSWAHAASKDSFTIIKLLSIYNKRPKKSTCSFCGMSGITFRHLLIQCDSLPANTKLLRLQIDNSIAAINSSLAFEQVLQLPSLLSLHTVNPYNELNKLSSSIAKLYKLIVAQHYA